MGHLAQRGCEITQGMDVKMNVLAITHEGDYGLGSSAARLCAYLFLRNMHTTIDSFFHAALYVRLFLEEFNKQISGHFDALFDRTKFVQEGCPE